MNTNNTNRSSLFFKRDFICGKCGATEFVLGEQVYSRSCEKCGAEELKGNVRFLLKSFFKKTKQLVSSIFF